MSETTTLTISEFLKARYFDDEQIAHAIAFAQVGGWLNPTRVLEDIMSKRAIVDQYEAAFENSKAHPDDFAAKGALLALHGVVRLLAAPYRTHPGYRSEWA